MINALIVSVGKKYIHPQTGFIHYCYHQNEEAYDVTIPIYENLLYIYALFKTKSIENINEAKVLLSSILSFQNNESKNFPIYLHEYPSCKNSQLPFKILPVFTFIIKQFESVLGEKLLQKLKHSIFLLIQFGLDYCSKGFLRIEHKFILSASIYSFQKVLGPELSKDAEVILESIDIHDLEKKVFYPHSLGDILTACQMFSPLFEKFPLEFFKFFTPSLGLYTGPLLQIVYEGPEPQVCLYDYHCASISGVYSNRILNENISLLYASLVQPYKNKLFQENVIRLSGALDNKPWNYIRNLNYSVSSIDIPLNKEDSNWKTSAPFCLSWGDLSFVQTLMLQSGNYQTIKTVIDEHKITIQLELSENFDLEDKEKKNEVILWLSKHPETVVTIQDQKATTFKIHDTLFIHSNQLKLKITYKLLEGDIQVLGHVMPGNRPSQMAHLKKVNYEAYDWQILLRTLRRTSQKNIIQVTIDIL